MGITDGIQGGDCCVIHRGDCWRGVICGALVCGSGVLGVVGGHVRDMSDGSGAASAHSVAFVVDVEGCGWFVVGGVVEVVASSRGGMASDGIVVE